MQAPGIERETLREALDETARSDTRWTREEEREAQLRTGSGDEEAMAFSREAGDGLAAARLVLWSAPDGYSVANIVPLESSSFSHAEYNALLSDFQKRIAVPASNKSGHKVEVSSGAAALEDWVSPETATALRRFSALANKSTGSAHPLDQTRWLSFVILAHRDSPPLGPGRLCRWLVEIEHWSDDVAQLLAIEYEFGLALLAQYDQSDR
ncbi:hypothetical protein [Variovorax sp. efr-133-TYG-130]|uniref:hypothetical protein n=1 Tax=Variovorax sp. efr-133-TYG-130 TaxID=3040327 RepID=UPI0025571F3C|nr:hypothetical protein [Variovorax sp. efr-133-TYG-130]